jgi:hypothetical protein
MKKYSVLFTLVAILIFTTPVYAQGGDGPGDPLAPVVTDAGHLDTGNMTDHGVVTESASWMPNVPFLNGQAQWHEYSTSEGTTVKVPTASTLFFMAANPYESGLTGAIDAIGHGGGSTIMVAGAIFGSILGTVPGFSAGDIVSHAVNSATTDVIARDTYFQQVRDGAAGHGYGIHQTGFNLLGSLFTIIGDDYSDGGLGNTGFYTTALVYDGGGKPDKDTGNSQVAPAAAGADGASPNWNPKCPGGVCPLGPPVYPHIPKPEIPECQPPHAKVGGIHAGAEKTDPNYPLVVGQDPGNRGVDVKYTVTVDPINYYWETLEVVGTEEVCVCPIGDDACTTGPAQCEDVEIYACVPHHKLICEPLNFASGTASLAQSSRDWITHELSLWYPNATVRRPEWEFGGGKGSCNDGQQYTWELIEKYVPLEDPGYYDQAVWGRTADTPVSVGRFFDLGGLNQFSVAFIDTTIIQ